MIEIMIRQKTSITHTKFILLDDGKVFGEENFAMAKEWRDQGLLGERTALLIDNIVLGKSIAYLQAKGILVVAP